MNSADHASSNRTEIQQVPDGSRVAIVFRLDRPGGMQSCCFSLMKGLNRRGIIPEVLWDVEPDWALLKKLGIKATFRRTPFRVPTHLEEKLPDTVRFLAGPFNKIDGTQLRADYDFFYIFHNSFLASKDIPHIRYAPVPMLFQMNPEYTRGWKSIPSRTVHWIYKTFLRSIGPVYDFHRGENHVTIAEFTAGIFKDMYGVDLPIVYPPIDIAKWEFHPDDLVHRDTLTFFSRIVSYKRPEFVLQLAARHPELRCVIMGGLSSNHQKYYAGLQEQARSLGIRAIEFIPSPSQQRVQAEMARTRFYVFPAINEHFGMTTPEAIAAGAIPFVHDSGGQREIVPDARLRFTDPEFHERFDALVRLSEQELNRIRASLSQHIQQYSEECYISQMLSYLPDGRGQPL